MRLILVRHGESIGNFENRLQGQTDYELTDLGRRQAELTAERLLGLSTSAVYSSPLLRARATAETIAARLGIEADLRPDLSEYHFGEMSGSTYAEVRERFSSTAPAERTYPGEEGRDNFFRRVTECVWQIAGLHRGETVAVVSHGGPIALFCQSVLGLPYRRPMPFAIDNCSLAVIEVDDGDGLSREQRTLLTSLNDTCHLRQLRKD
jgi:broad specificity phosphatase PhoE